MGDGLVLSIGPSGLGRLLPRLLSELVFVIGLAVAFLGRPRGSVTCPLVVGVLLGSPLAHLLGRRLAGEERLEIGARRATLGIGRRTRRRGHTVDITDGCDVSLARARRGRASIRIRCGDEHLTTRARMPVADAERVADALRRHVDAGLRAPAPAPAGVRSARLTAARTDAARLSPFALASGGLATWRLPLGAVVPLAMAALVFASAAARSDALVSWAFVGVVTVLATVVRGGLLDIVVHWRRGRLVERLPSAPWRWEQRFRGRVLVARPWSRCGRTGVLLLVSGALAALVLLAFGAASCIGILGCGALGFAAVQVWRLQRLLFQGTTELQLHCLPYAPRGRIDVDFAVARAGAQFHRIRFALRRLEQREPNEGRARPAVIETCIVPGRRPRPATPPGPDDRVPVSFDVPDGWSGNDLDGPVPVLWEVLVTGDTTSGRYEQRFPLPVYDVAASVPLDPPAEP